MPKLSNIKHVFFDLDHTLWDFETNSKKAYEYIFNKNELNIAIDKFIEIYEPINHAYWKLYREEKISQKNLKYARLKDTFDHINYTINDELIWILAEEYLQNLPNYNHLFDGTIDLLNYLKPKYNLHIITNGFHEIQSAKLINSKINHFFDRVITSESVLVKKPNPKIFFHALEKAQAKTYESIMIGDNLEADIYGAKNIGMPAIYCDFDNKNTNNNIKTVTKLSQIRQYL
jgi:putative hydrolase of the HAD superfamily